MKTERALKEFVRMLAEDNPEPSELGWEPGAVVEITHTPVPDYAVDLDVFCVGLRYVLVKPRSCPGANGWWRTTGPDVNKSCARVVAPPYRRPTCGDCSSTSDNRTSSASRSTTGERDWRKEPEVGDGIQRAPERAELVVATARGSGVWTNWGKWISWHEWASWMVHKRPDKPGDGMEHIEHPEWGIGVWRSTPRPSALFRAETTGYCACETDRSKLRRVYAVR